MQLPRFSLAQNITHFIKIMASGDELLLGVGGVVEVQIVTELCSLNIKNARKSIYNG